jgi:hypothetical protein
VKKFSVKRISNPLMFDPLNNAVPEGLYDPALGPTENHQRCVASPPHTPRSRRANVRGLTDAHASCRREWRSSH